MPTERQRREREKQDEISDEYIKDQFKNFICGSKNYYHDNKNSNTIGALVAQADGGGVGISKYKDLVIKEWELPDEFKDPIWKLDKAEEYFKLFNEAIVELYKLYNPPELEENWDIDYEKAGCKIDIDDDKLVTRMSNIDSNFLYKIVVFDGIIMNKSESMLYPKRIVYRCNSCSILYEEKHNKCNNCENKNSIKLSDKDTTWSDYEHMTIQERQDDMNKKLISTTPKTLELYVKDSLTNKFKPGDNVRVTGFLKPKKDITEESLNAGLSSISLPKVSRIVDVYNIQYIGTPQDVILAEPSKYITHFDERAILNLRKKYSDDQEFFEILSNSFVPEIYGRLNEKKALLLQAVGPGVSDRGRWWINILLLGDPGTGKSHLGDAACELNMHFAKAVGKGASGVGLTASIISVNGINRLSIGAAVMADKGLCFIDEFSNISDEHKEHLRECMESGTFSMNKQGFNVILNARGPYLIASNPDVGTYSTQNSITENVKISPAILSRFDFIFVMVDTRDKGHHQKIRTQITARINKKKSPLLPQEDSKTEIIDKESLKKYIFYAKTRDSEPYVLPEARTLLDNFHDDLMTPERSSDITADTRAFQGMLRIAMALTRLLLKTEVTKEIAEMTIKLMNTAYESTGMKVGNSTGLNMNMIYPQQLDRLNPKKAFAMVMKNLTKGNTKSVEKEAVMFELRDMLKIDLTECYELWNKMDRAGALMVENGRYYKLNYDNLI